MSEELTTTELAKLLLGEMGKRYALECAVETLIMASVSTKPGLLEPMKGIFQQLAEEKWEDMEDDYCKPAFQEASGRLFAVLEMAAKS